MYESQKELFRKQMVVDQGMAASDFEHTYGSKVRRAKEAFPDKTKEYQLYKAEQLFHDNHVNKRYGQFLGIRPESEPEAAAKVTGNNALPRQLLSEPQHDHRRPRSPRIAMRRRSRSPKSVVDSRRGDRWRPRRSASPLREGLANRDFGNRMSVLAGRKRDANERAKAVMNLVPTGPSAMRLPHKRVDLKPATSAAVVLRPKAADFMGSKPAMSSALVLPSRRIENLEPKSALFSAKRLDPSSRWATIPLATREDELDHLAPFFASKNGWPRFCSFFKQKNAADAWLTSVDRRNALQREFPRLRFRHYQAKEGFAIWVEPPTSDKVDGYVLPEVYGEMLESAYRILKIFSNLKVEALPAVDLFVQDYFKGKYDV